jgi:hypothetical protein
VNNLGVDIAPTGRVYEYSKLPNSLDELRNYYAERGYAENPPLEMKEEGQVVSFAKPIPSESGQSRHHVRIKETRKYYVIDSHVDKYDPEKDQLGHLTDILNPPEHHLKRVRKTD